MAAKRAVKKPRGKKKEKKSVMVGIAHVDATFNNIHVTITDKQGKVIARASSGMKGFRGSKKSTPWAGQVTAEDACIQAQEKSTLQEVDVRVKGPGSGREAALRTVSNFFTIKSITDTTPIPHNGCRPPKRRRV